MFMLMRLLRTRRKWAEEHGKRCSEKQSTEFHKTSVVSALKNDRGPKIASFVISAVRPPKFGRRQSTKIRLERRRARGRLVNNLSADHGHQAMRL